MIAAGSAAALLSGPEAELVGVEPAVSLLGVVLKGGEVITAIASDPDAVRVSEAQRVRGPASQRPSE